jgi:hypothetical protein
VGGGGVGGLGPGDSAPSAPKPLHAGLNFGDLLAFDLSREDRLLALGHLNLSRGNRQRLFGKGQNGPGIALLVVLLDHLDVFGDPKALQQKGNDPRPRDALLPGGFDDLRSIFSDVDRPPVEIPRRTRDQIEDLKRNGRL